MKKQTNIQATQTQIQNKQNDIQKYQLVSQFGEYKSLIKNIHLLRTEVSSFYEYARIYIMEGLRRNSVDLILKDIHKARENALNLTSEIYADLTTLKIVMPNFKEQDRVEIGQLIKDISDCLLDSNHGINDLNYRFEKNENKSNHLMSISAQLNIIGQNQNTLTLDCNSFLTQGERRFDVEISGIYNVHQKFQVYLYSLITKIHEASSLSNANMSIIDSFKLNNGSTINSSFNSALEKVEKTISSHY